MNLNYLCSMKQTKSMMMTGLMMMSALIVGCSTLTSAEREAEKAKRTAYVTKCLDSKHFVIDVDMMIPRRGSSRTLPNDWSLEVKGDTLVSYLPYIGVAHEPLFGDDKGLNFTAPIKTYEDKGFSKGKRTIRLQVNNGGEVIDYCLDVSDEGYANIDVNPRKRDGISFSGQMADKE